MVASVTVIQVVKRSLNLVNHDAVNVIQLLALLERASHACIGPPAQAPLTFFSKMTCALLLVPPTLDANLASIGGKARTFDCF